MILIQLEGGLVQGVFSDEPAAIGTDVALADYDPEAYDNDDLVDVFGDGDRFDVRVLTVREMRSSITKTIEIWRDQQ